MDPFEQLPGPASGGRWRALSVRIVTVVWQIRWRLWRMWTRVICSGRTQRPQQRGSLARVFDAGGQCANV